MTTNYYNANTRPRVKYVYEDVPETEEEKRKKAKEKEKNNKLKDTRTPPLKKKFDDDTEKSNGNFKHSEKREANETDTVKSTSSNSDIRIKCPKFTIFACCMVSLLVSFGMLALGVFLKSDLRFSQFLSENYRQVTETQFTAPTLYKATYALIVVGSLTIVICFFGCCGAIHENVCLLGSYFGILIVIFLLQISAGVLWYFRRDAIQEEMALALDYMVQHYYQGPGIVQEVMDSIQTIFRCCGNSGCGDYSVLVLTIPRTCDLDCYGCRERIFRVLRDGFTVITVFGIAMLLAEVLAIVMAMYLICRIKERSPKTPLVYELKVQNMPANQIHSTFPTSDARKSPSSEKKKADAKQAAANTTKVVYVAYPVHSMPPPPPYSGNS